MERRIALKNMGMALGLTVATPTLISLLQSCQGEPEMSWTPIFFTPEQGTVLTQLVDIIIPKTDTPSASEVQVHVFLDRYVQEVSSNADQQLMIAGLNALITLALSSSGKDKRIDLASQDLEAVLAPALAARGVVTAVFRAAVLRAAVVRGGDGHRGGVSDGGRRCGVGAVAACGGKCDAGGRKQDPWIHPGKVPAWVPRRRAAAESSWCGHVRAPDVDLRDRIVPGRGMCGVGFRR